LTLEELFLSVDTYPCLLEERLLFSRHGRDLCAVFEVEAVSVIIDLRRWALRKSILEFCPLSYWY